MKYSHNYSKLEKKEYTTIRRYSKGKEGEIIMEDYPNGNHFAKIMKVERRSLEQISTDFLMKDTDCKTRMEAIDLIQSFYKVPIDEKEKLYIYYLRRAWVR